MFAGEPEGSYERIIATLVHIYVVVLYNKSVQPSVSMSTEILLPEFFARLQTPVITIFQIDRTSTGNDVEEHLCWRSIPR